VLMMPSRADVAMYGLCGSGELKWTERPIWSRRAEVALEGLWCPGELMWPCTAYVAQES
jgi:hypothetical protein